MSKLFPLLVEKKLSNHIKPKTVKKMRNGNLLVEIETKTQSNKIEIN